MGVENRELVVGHALDEVAVVAHHDQGARPGVEQVFGYGKHVGVEVVGGFVHDEHVGLVEEDEQQLQPAALAARQVFHAGVDLVAREAEPLAQGGGRKLAALHHVVGFVAAKHDADHVVFDVGEFGEVLRQGGELHGLADFDVTERGLEGPVEHREQGRFTRAVLAQDADAVARSDVPGHVGKNATAAAVDADVVELQALLAQTGRGHLLELDRVAQGGHVGDQFLGRFHVEFGLTAAGLGAAREPGKLAPQLVFVLLLGERRKPVALDALHDVGRKAAFEGVDLAVVHFPHVLADGV